MFKEYHFKLLTKDCVTVVVDAVVYFHISNPVSRVVNVASAYASTRLLAQTTLRSVLGTRNLNELLSDGDGIGKEIQVMI